ncbi:MAG: hypothetical protein ABIU63_05000 [Chitinophagaceae bacterium]
MKKLILGIFLLAGVATLHAQEDTSMKKKMHHNKMKSDSTGQKMKKDWNKNDSSRTRPMYKDKKMDSTSVRH